MAKTITEERAERIARSHACVKCGEYTYKHVSVKKSPADGVEGVAWVAEKECGVCETLQELGIAEDGRIVYIT